MDFASSLHAEMSSRVLLTLPVSRAAIQSFLWEMITNNADGSTSELKTVPCAAGGEYDVCLADVSSAVSMVNFGVSLLSKESVLGSAYNFESYLESYRTSVVYSAEVKTVLGC